MLYIFRAWKRKHHLSIITVHIPSLVKSHDTLCDKQTKRVFIISWKSSSSLPFSFTFPHIQICCIVHYTLKTLNICVHDTDLRAHFRVNHFFNFGLCRELTRSKALHTRWRREAHDHCGFPLGWTQKTMFSHNSSQYSVLTYNDCFSLQDSPALNSREWAVNQRFSQLSGSIWSHCAA